VKVLVDTSVWISYFNEHQSIATKKLEALVESRQELFTSPMIVQEILQGLRLEKTATNFSEVLRGLTLLPHGFEEAEISARIFRELRRKGRTLGTIDAHVAGLCLLHGLELLTTDSDFKSIPGVKLVTI
jgi:predicted nucleic acid-binding protein